MRKVKGLLIVCTLLLVCCACGTENEGAVKGTAKSLGLYTELQSKDLNFYSEGKNKIDILVPVTK